MIGQQAARGRADEETGAQTRALIRIVAVAFAAIAILACGSGYAATAHEASGVPSGPIQAPTRLSELAPAPHEELADCTAEMRTFVSVLDETLAANPNSIHEYNNVMRRYLPSRRCVVDDVISEARKSKFFVDAYNMGWSHTISFMNSIFIVSFGLNKDGQLMSPATRVRLDRR